MNEYQYRKLQMRRARYDLECRRARRNEDMRLALGVAAVTLLAAACVAALVVLAWSRSALHDAEQDRAAAHADHIAMMGGMS